MRVTQMNAFPEKEGTPYRVQYRSVQRHYPLNPVNNTAKKLSRVFSKFETDDYILAAIIIDLILEGCDDYILLAALGYLFVMGFDWG